MQQSDFYTPAEREARARRQIGREFQKGERIAKIAPRLVPNAVNPDLPVTMHSITFIATGHDTPVEAAPGERLVTADFLDQLDDIVASGRCYNSAVVKDVLQAARPAKTGYQL